MITIRNGQKMQFLIYKTHLPQIAADCRIIIKNLISDYEEEVAFQMTELYNSHRIELAETDLSAISGQNTLFVKDADGDTIYEEEVFIF